MALEGNACYKFSTLKTFIQQNHCQPIRTIIEIGTNVGEITVMMKQYFPESTIYTYEAVPEYLEKAINSCKHLPNIHFHHAAITSCHKYLDDLGEQSRQDKPCPHLLRALPASGNGWLGGSMITFDSNAINSNRYRKEENRASIITLEELIQDISSKTLNQAIDLIKIDCEGCEISSIGCATIDALSKVRYITGEYHNLNRFYPVLANKLFQTHKVNIVGGAEIGSFFAERRGDSDSELLISDNTGMLQLRPWLMPTPLQWHIFNESYVAASERASHGMA